MVQALFPTFTRCYKKLRSKFSLKSAWWQSDLSTVLAVCAAIFLICHRPGYAFIPNWETDDGFIMARMQHFLGLEITTGLGDYHSHNYYAPGASLALLPGGFFGLLMAMVFGGAVQSWIWSITGLWSFCFYGGSLFLMIRIINKGLGDFSIFNNHVYRNAMLILMNIPVLYFAAHRPLMSHSVELFLSLMILALLLERRYVKAVICASVISIVRYNDLLVFIPIAGRVFDELNQKTNPFFGVSKGIRLALVTLIVGTVIGIGLRAFVIGYAGSTIQEMVASAQIGYNIQSFLFSPSWGVTWTLPLWFLCLILGPIFFRSMNWFLRGAWIYMLLSASIYLFWGSNGGSFGQRYLIGTFPFSFLIWAHVLQNRRNFLRFFYAVAWASAAVLVVLLMFFQLTQKFLYSYSESHLIFRVFESAGNLAIYKRMFGLSPLGIVWHSWFDPYNLDLLAYILIDGAKWVLTIAVVGSVVYLFYYFLAKKVGANRQSAK